MTPDNPGDPAEPEKRPHRKTPPATPAVQAWLDGEQEKDRLLNPDEQETAELWTRINSETERLRRRSTPIHVQQRILSSLPDEPPGAPGPAGIPMPDKSGSLRVRISTAILAGAALLAVGALFGAMFFGR
jgi:hypothetical protein